MSVNPEKSLLHPTQQTTFISVSLDVLLVPSVERAAHQCPRTQDCLLGDSHRVLLVAPKGPVRIWFSALISLLDGEPWQLPVSVSFNSGYGHWQGSVS